MSLLLNILKTLSFIFNSNFVLILGHPLYIAWMNKSRQVIADRNYCIIRNGLEVKMNNCGTNYINHELKYIYR